jgi:hypothetical protein
MDINIYITKERLVLVLVCVLVNVQTSMRMDIFCENRDDRNDVFCLRGYC